jgi:hypothetical protein
MATTKEKPRGKVKVRAGKAAKKAPAKAGKAAAKRAVKPIKASAKKADKPGQGVKARAARLALFVHEYLKANFNGTKAAIAVGYSPTSARFQASELLALPEVQEKLSEAIAKRAERVKIDTDDVLKRMYAVATADARELTELYHCCCRYCWGKGNKYQYTPRELGAARRDYEVAALKATAENQPVLAFDEAGGIGFDPRKDPNPDCPECFGRGVDEVVFKDTRDLPPSASLLFAGVKVTQHGMEIKTHDQMGMLLNVGKHLGMFETKVRHSGNVGVHQTVSDLLDDIDGAGTGLPSHVIPKS